MPTHTHTPTRTHGNTLIEWQTRADVYILQSSHSAWQTHRGICHVGSVECLFPSTRGWTALISQTHRYKQTDTYAKSEAGLRTPGEGGATLEGSSIKKSLLFWFKEHFSTHWGENIVYVIFYSLFFSPRYVYTYLWDKVIRMYTHAHTLLPEIFLCNL